MEQSGKMQDFMYSSLNYRIRVHVLSSAMTVNQEDAEYQFLSEHG